jgi:hypothetical protein
MHAVNPPQNQTAGPPERSRGSFDELISTCLQRTAAALFEAGRATEEELRQSIDAVKLARERGKIVDIIEQLARVQGHDEEHITHAILELTDGIASTLPSPPLLIPFAGKLIAPSAFYASYEQIHETAKHLLAPVIYAEDTDAIGCASVNPIAAQLLAEQIQQTVMRRVGIRPFVTISRMDYESWTFLTRKHFEL